ncbi:MAG TPA: hypothetical protein VGX23_28050 [Actinocrinis sp.]|nr:hypothetical protein [Actinocrinis sp.]
MLFVEENGRRSKTYDFTPLPLSPELREWLAQAFARVTGPRSGAKRTGTADHYFQVVKRFAAVLAGAQPTPTVPRQVTAAHIAAFKLSAPAGSYHQQVAGLRTLLRQDGLLRPDVRRAVCEGRLPARPLPTVTAYTDVERQRILTAARGDIRRARDRVAAGRELLERYRRGEAPAGDQARLGAVLDVVDRTGDLPRHACGQIPDRLYHLGGVMTLMSMLCLTRLEAMAFAVLLVDLTGENFGTVIDWPAAHLRPDGGDGPVRVALVEETKPRRGPSREHMVLALEDLPASLGAVVETDRDHRLLRSPLRTYLLLVELGALARKHSGSTRAFTYLAAGGREKWSSKNHSFYVGQWAQGHGFPRAPARSGTAAADTPTLDGSGLSVSTQRLRQTALERRRHPIAHAPSTLNDYYLRRSPAVVEDSRAIVREALDAEVAKARLVQHVPVFSREFLERAGHDPAGAAAAMGVDEPTLKDILAGERDTVLASCTDHRNAPDTPPGDACEASFLTCLSCPNARALPHQLPIQVTAHDQIAALRADLDPAEWDHRFGEVSTRLADLLGHYGIQEREDARARARPEDHERVMALLTGRLDLR